MGRMLLLDQIINPANNQVEGFCIVRSVVQKSNVKGSDYLDFVLCDAGGEVNAKLWDYNVEQHGHYEPDTIIKVRGTITLWKEAEQLKIDRIRNLKDGEAVDMARLIPCAPLPPQEMYDALYACAEAFENNDLRMLTQYILRENKEDLLRWPAALKLHHAMRGGLLYHTLFMLRAAKALCSLYKDIYPDLDVDLVCAGVILHDVAKIPELTVGKLGAGLRLFHRRPAAGPHQHRRGAGGTGCCGVDDRGLGQGVGTAHPPFPPRAAGIWQPQSPHVPRGGDRFHGGRVGFPLV